MVNKIKNKRGISEVVTVVLIVMLSVVLVSMLGYFIINFVRDNVSFSNQKVDISIDLRRDTPCYNPTTQQLGVYVVRGPGVANLSGIKIIAQDASGNTQFQINNKILKELESYQFVFYGLSTTPTKVKVAPIISLGKKTKELEATAYEDVEVSTSCVIYSATLDTAKINSPSVPLSPNGNISNFIS